MKGPEGMGLARSTDGRVIHRDSCRYATRSNHWHWADTNDRKNVEDIIWLFGYRLCRVCRPDLDIGEPT